MQNFVGLICDLKLCPGEEKTADPSLAVSNSLCGGV
jgi:hypothetical protein